MKCHKQLIPCVILAVAVLLGLFLLPTAARAATSGQYTYEVRDGNAIITRYNTNASGAVTVPATLDDYPVTEIGDSAFSNCARLTGITLPESITSIGNSAFSGCYGLKNITIPQNVTSIGKSAFYNCSSLRNINIPERVTAIGEEAFFGCRNLNAVYITDLTAWLRISFGGQCANPLQDNSSNNTLYLNGTAVTEVEIPVEFTKIPDYAFAGHSGLQSVIIPESVTVIGNSAFYGCRNLADITLPAGVTHLGDSAFYGCSSLQSITIPAGVKAIGPWTFYSCTGLTDVALPAGVVEIGEFAFSCCSNLISVILPEGITAIGDSAFAYCGSLTHIVIPEGVTKIGEYMFWYCKKLASINIPAGVTTVDMCAFDGCTRLKTVYYGGSEDQWNKISIGKYNSNLIQANILYNHIHDYTQSPPAAVPATCTEHGGIQSRCSCGEVFYTNVQVALGHEISALRAIVPVTCTEDGYSVYGCIRCDVTENREFEEKLGHQMVTVPAVAPTCTEPGLTEGKKCERCSMEELAQSAVPATGHGFVDGVCTVCGEKNGNPDFTGDGVITDADAVYLLRYTLFPEDYPVSGNADINGDGIVSDADAVYLLRYTLFPEDYPLFPKKEN